MSAYLCCDFSIFTQLNIRLYLFYVLLNRNNFLHFLLKQHSIFYVLLFICKFNTVLEPVTGRSFTLRRRCYMPKIVDAAFSLTHTYKD